MSGEPANFNARAMARWLASRGRPRTKRRQLGPRPTLGDAARYAVGMDVVRTMSAPRAASVRSRGDPLGPEHFQRQAAALCALHRLRQQGRDDPASGLGRQRRRLPAVPGGDGDAMSRRCRALFRQPRQPTAGARSSQPQCQVLHAKAACGLTVRMAVEPATSAKATAASPRNFFMGVSSLNRLLPRLPLAVQAVCDRQHKKAHLAGTRVSLGDLTWRRSRFC